MGVTLLGLSLSLRKVRADSHQTRQELKAETMVEYCLLACSRLTFSYFSCIAQSYLPKDGTILSRTDSPINH